MRIVCPGCGGSRVHHSRPRSIVERVRRSLTGRAPFRCHSCGWRGWMRDVPGHAAAPDGVRHVHGDLSDAELERLEVGSAEGDSK